MTKRVPEDSDQVFADEDAQNEATRSRIDDALDRVLSRAGRSESATVIRDLTGGAQALDADTHDLDADLDAIRMEREDRASLRRVGSLSTELEDVTEVEYRQLRLEKVVLIGIYSEKSTEDAENSLRELAALAETAGAEVLDGLLQRRAKPDPATYLGKGKAQELTELVAAVGADTVIADTELAPSQRRALEDVVKVKVIDRTAVILDIFSQHAKSREGKAQVELAQLQYLLPRLRGWGESMSPPGGRTGRLRGCRHGLARPRRDKDGAGSTQDPHPHGETAQADPGFCPRTRGEAR